MEGISKSGSGSSSSSINPPAREKTELAKMQTSYEAKMARVQELKNQIENAKSSLEEKRKKNVAMPEGSKEAFGKMSEKYESLRMEYTALVEAQKKKDN